LRKQTAGEKCILVLDEATSNLDEATEKVVWRVLGEEFKDVTVITAAHRLETVRDADLIIMLQRGEVIGVGTPEEIL
jgi:ABC-type multidrug transport system fused ATPase/permease subunit